jgi:Malate/L-lactate dehydrogenases
MQVIVEAVDKMVAPRKEVTRFVTAALKAVGAREDNAQQLADVLVDADYKGHFSHGINRIGKK